MAFKGWDRVTIETNDGPVEGIAPVIISASRSTDIPAFHTERFLERLNAGYIKWVNPFNRSQPQYVSFEKTRMIVFWTKNPNPIISHLSKIREMGINYYFTYTLNDYEEENLEPNLPPLEERIETFKKLSQKIGKGRVLWRFDPLILSDTITVSKLLDKIKKVGDKIHPFTNKLIISFVDIGQYNSVKRNLDKKTEGNFREFKKGEMLKFAKGLRALNKSWNLELATCSEESELENYGISHNRCIDGELMAREFEKDKDLMIFLGLYPKPVNLSGKLIIGDKIAKLKDKGQRKVCGCIVSKDIGRYNSCMHLCTYCYANHNEKRVISNMENDDLETL